MATIRDAISVEADKHRQAELRWELGRLAERAGDDAAAVKAYLGAYNQAPGFRPPLFDLIRIFERRRSFKNLARLYDAEYRSGRTDEDRASALADLAALLEDRGTDTEQPIERLNEALTTEPGPALATAALFLERSARRAGNRGQALHALEARVSSAKDLTWKALLTCDLAATRAESGAEEDVRLALAELTRALEWDVARYRLLETLERIARRHDHPGALARALEGLGDLAAAAARGEHDAPGSGAFSVQRFADSARAGGRAAACYFEAAGLLLQRLHNATGALENLRKAVAIRPDDELLRLVLVEAAHRASDAETVLEQTSAVVAEEGDTPANTAAALLFYAAHASGSSGDETKAYGILERVLTLAPDSIAARATADAWMMSSGRFDAWIDALRDRKASGHDRTLSLWRAASLAAHRLGDFPRARPLYEQAAEHAPHPVAVLRDHYAAATRAGNVEGMLEAIVALLPHDLEPEERGSLVHHRYVLLREAGRDDEAARALLHALDLEGAKVWAADAARVYAARSGAHELLAKAHRVLSELSEDEAVAASHLAASGRALVKAGNEDDAIETLKQALERQPGHGYALALLEELYRARGEADEVVRLLRRSADARSGARAAVVSLLLAGAAAEASGDAKLAAETYEDAADSDPSSVSPLWALARLAEGTGDDALLLRAREGLSEREIAGDAPARSTLDLAEHYLGIDKPELAESPLRASLESSVAIEAATTLSVLREDKVDPTARIAALEKLLAAAQPEDHDAIRRELGATAEHDDLLPALGEEVIAAFLEREEDDPWALLLALGAASRDRRLEERSELLLRLGQTTDDGDARAELTLLGLRAQIVGAGVESDVAEDAFLIAQELLAEGTDAPAAAIAAEETLSVGDDPDAFADALLARMPHTSSDTKVPVAAAAGRTLSAAHRPEAVGVLRQVLAGDPDDLASWEALRVAARASAEWTLVVRVCDKLAEHVTGDFRNELLEEAGAVLMDHLDRPDLAEERLRQVVEADRSRPNAYHRLHDLVAERGDTEAIMALVQARIDAINDGDELERLFYEKARLHRSGGELDQALEAIENLLMLEEGHAGGLALAVEIYVSRSQWAEAVESLRAIARADVPAKQKRISHLGAADFLEKKLGDPVAALAELEEVEKLGMADAKVFERMARIAINADMHEKAAQFLLEAAGRAEGARRSELAKHAGRLQVERLGERDAAIVSYRDALTHTPTDIEAGNAIAELLSGEARVVHSRSFEAAVRSDMAGEVQPDHLRALRRVAVWREDALFEQLILSALVAVGEATPEESAAMQPPAPVGLSATPLSANELASLRAEGDDGPLAAFAELAHDTLCVAAGLEPGHLGVGRGDALSARRPHPVRDELAGRIRLFGLELGDVYQGGNDAGRVQSMPGKRAPTWVVGSGVQSPLDGLRCFLVGEQAMASLTHTTPLVRRDPDDAATLLHAVAAAVDAPLGGSQDRPGLVDWTHRVMKAMPRKTKRLIPTAVATIPSADALTTYCAAARQTAMRAGLLLAGDLQLVLTALLNGGAPTLPVVLAHPDARALLNFWLSPAMLELRRRLVG
ncbi:MAG: hypothetical protein AAGE52_08570 [Myxococcota bacterium]